MSWLVKQVKLQQYEEVQNVKWSSLDEIPEFMRQRKFIPYHESFVKLLFEMQYAVGVIREDI